MSELKHVSSKELGLKGMDNKGWCGVYQRVVKRILDILFSLIALPLVALVGIPVAVMIKAEDGGPIFYRSPRIGRDFRLFDMLKFRSMKVNAPNILNPDGSTYNSQTDDRVTKVGRWIRETSIDELPQILNVLKGDMSLIGPRAGDTDGIGTYTEEEKGKMLVRPGITGYSQAYFRNGLGVGEKRMYDAWYAHNVSFPLDVRIFLKTIGTVLRHDNIYTN